MVKVEYGTGFWLLVVFVTVFAGFVLMAAGVLGFALGFAVLMDLVVIRDPLLFCLIAATIVTLLVGLWS